MATIDGRAVLITGGTGSFGRKFAVNALEKYNPKKLIVYSRDEYKHYQMQNQFARHKDKLRFFIGDVRDKDRLYRAFEGVDIVIHAAALKHVPLMEYNPIEAVRTNVNGAENVINAAIDRGIEKVIALSTDKAVGPVNLYGATKLVSDKLFVAANAYSGAKRTRFSVVRYGNVAGSRGSVIPYFRSLIDAGKSALPITDERMTRFWISLDEAVEMVFTALEDGCGGEIYVGKIPSFKVTDLARAMLPDCDFHDIGIRPGEKLHEAMITEEDAATTIEFHSSYIVYPNFDWWKRDDRLTGGAPAPKRFRYSSDTNKEWLDTQQLRELLQTIDIVY